MFLDVKFRDKAWRCVEENDSKQQAVLITDVLSGKSKESTTNWLLFKFTMNVMPEAQEVLR